MVCWPQTQLSPVTGVSSGLATSGIPMAWPVLFRYSRALWDTLGRHVYAADDGSGQLHSRPRRYLRHSLHRRSRVCPEAPWGPWRHGPFQTVIDGAGSRRRATQRKSSPHPDDLGGHSLRHRRDDYVYTPGENRSMSPPDSLVGLPFPLHQIPITPISGKIISSLSVLPHSATVCKSHAWYLPCCPRTWHCTIRPIFSSRY